ncbi:hypothetical protein [Thermoactinomyces mirandus]|nr:hypothetical protein [Thermoactinomyces mirandus]
METVFLHAFDIWRDINPDVSMGSLTGFLPENSYNHLIMPVFIAGTR